MNTEAGWCGVNYCKCFIVVLGLGVLWSVHL